MTLRGRLQEAVRRIVARTPQQRVSRALVKTILYRAVMVVVTIVVAFFVTGDTGDALSIGILANVVKTGTYYAYERLWDRISWGVPTTSS